MSRASPAATITTVTIITIPSTAATVVDNQGRSSGSTGVISVPNTPYLILYPLSYPYSYPCSTPVCPCYQVLSELVLTSSKFMSQFVECRGLEAILRASQPPQPLPQPLSLSFPSSSSSRSPSSSRLPLSAGNNVRMSRVYAEQEMVVCLLQVLTIFSY